MLQRVCALLIFLTLQAVVVTAQVPYEMSQAKPWRTVWKLAMEGSTASEPLYVQELCLTYGQDLLIARTERGGRTFWTRPRIDTALPDPSGWGTVYHRYDYDGTGQLEYMNEKGRVDRCTESGYPFQKQSIDTIDCKYVDLKKNFSADVDDDGFMDVVCGIGRGDRAFVVISGGPQTGISCERLNAFSPPDTGCVTAPTFAFYKGALGRWRLVHVVHDGAGDDQSHLVLYDVAFSRRGPRGADLLAVFTPIDSLTVIPVSATVYAFKRAIIVQDTVLKRDYMVLQYRPNFKPWVTERFDLTNGQFVASGEQVTGLELSWYASMPSLGHSLGTPYPVFHASSAMDGELYFSVYDLVRPIAYWRPEASGMQPVVGRAIINDQTGDGRTDMVVTGGDTATLILLTLDSTIVDVEEQVEHQRDLHVDMSGMMLTVSCTRACTVAIDIATVDGQAVYSSPTTAISTGEYRHDLAPALQPLTTGAYYVRVRCDGQTVTIPIMHVRQ